MSILYKVVEHNYSIGELLVEPDSLNDDFTCSICFELVYKKIPLQCRSGCWYCEECWIKHLETNRKQCPQCRCIVRSVDDLSRSRFIERDFNKKFVNCPYSFILKGSIPPPSQSSTLTTTTTTTTNIIDETDKRKKPIEEDKKGCCEMIQIYELDTHMKECNFKFIQCRFQDCSEVVRLNQIHQHEIQCIFKGEQCLYCNRDDIVSRKLEDHYLVCPRKPIPCSQCNEMVKKELMESHIDNECGETVIPCKYEDVGCLVSMKRKEFKDHIDTINHSTFIEKKLDVQLHLISKLTNIVEDQNKKLVQLSEKFENYKRDYEGADKCLRKSDLFRIFPNITLTSPKEWCVSNYLKAVETCRVSQSFQSPTFNVGCFQFYITLYPKGITLENKEYTSLFLLLRPAYEGQTVTASFTVSLLNHHEIITSKVTNGHDKLFTQQGFGVIQFLKTDDITKSKGWLNESGELIINYSVQVKPENVN